MTTETTAADACDERAAYHGTATYSPEDNKLRLYPFARLDSETYARLKAAGFSWAPKQELFVAPMWTPEREDLLFELAGDIDDEDTSLVDRASERAERFEDYSEKRTRDARNAEQGVARIADNIPLGQPILVGHHSEKRARKDAERIEAGMRRTIRMWETAGYWTRRAKGAIRAAKYKERPDVRHRRIKRLEADHRKVVKQQTTAAAALAFWNSADLTHERARLLAGNGYGVPWGTYDALTKGEMTADEARQIARDIHDAQAPRIARWIAHYENRLAYERAMLDESGGLAADKWNLEPGGRVLGRFGWCVIERVNRRDGAITSVSVIGGNYGSTMGIEQIKDYQPPSDGDADKVKKATALGPIVNYPGEGFEPMTKAEYTERVPRWSDFPKLARYGATDEHGPYRVRQLPGPKGFFGPRISVYLTDQKIITPPKADGIREAQVEILEELPLPTPTVRPAYQEPEAVTNARRARETLKAGVTVVSAPQLFPTPPDLAARVIELAEIEAGMTVLEPSAGTGNLVRAVVEAVDTEIVGYEINRELCTLLAKVFPAYQLNIECADFLTVTEGMGQFPRIVMNPPFGNAQDIAHIRHAQKFLAPGGRLVALCANGPRQQEAFRAEADYWEDIDAGTFDGTNVRAALVVFTRPTAQPSLFEEAT